MWTAKWILDTYEKGDDLQRLDLYMIYRDLRNYFDELESMPKGAKGLKTPVVPITPSDPWSNSWVRLVKS